MGFFSEKKESASVRGSPCTATFPSLFPSSPLYISQGVPRCIKLSPRARVTQTTLHSVHPPYHGLTNNSTGVSYDDSASNHVPELGNNIYCDWNLQYACPPPHYPHHLPSHTIPLTVAVVGLIWTILRAVLFLRRSTLPFVHASIVHRCIPLVQTSHPTPSPGIFSTSCSTCRTLHQKSFSYGPPKQASPSQVLHQVCATRRMR
ncbi:hypothetical protein BKA82DRAFT_2808715 [Pisolithus tinctorius]|nr:hypothetical protein BKA82DRAFT_2808715 [Pisolithus tinctorius]